MGASIISSEGGFPIKTAAADPVLAIAVQIETLENEENAASLAGDGSLSWRLDGQLSQLDTQLALATPTTAAGAALKLRKAAYFGDNGEDDPVDGDQVARHVREIAGRVVHGSITLADLPHLRSAVPYFWGLENFAAADFVRSALRYLARPRLV